MSIAKSNRELKHEVENRRKQFPGSAVNRVVLGSIGTPQMPKRGRVRSETVVGCDMENSKVLSDWNWNRKTVRGLVSNLVIALLLVLAGNGLIFTLSPPATISQAPSLLNPPGWLIGMVWVLLFEAMAFARWLVLGQDDRRVQSSTWVAVLLLFCLAYPAYTIGLRSLTLGLIGNIATIGAALWVAVRVYKVSRVAAGLISCIVAWVAFATLVTLLQIQGRAT